ncbi:MAG: cardiolipin synthase [Clostridiaceae bacterium]|nr:cardiolipin synthase [Clostridiaceae bacterium]
MINFLTIVTWLFILGLVYFNLFDIIPDAIIMGVYPYVLFISLMLVISTVILRFIENTLVVNITKAIFIATSIFIFFTFVQIWRNVHLLNNYQEDRSTYMDQLMQITRERTYTDVDMNDKQVSISKLIEANIGIPLTYRNTASLFNDSKEIFNEIIKEIDKAQHHIHMEFFIVRDDHIGNKIKDLLKQKAQEGVEVRFLYDGLGGHRLSKSFRKELQETGVEVAAYDGVATSILKGKLNHRNHRKVVVIDGKVAMTGGVNLGDEYLNRDENIGNWEDALIKLEGEAVHWLQKVFLGDWYYATKKKLLLEDYFPEMKIDDTLPVQVVTSGYDTHWNEISQTYFSMITSAQESVYIATPYLILTDSMLKALETTALRGVNVNIVVPRKPDWFIVGWANSSYFSKLLKSGVNIYQYDNGFLHAKALMVDNKILTIGSANLNTRSMHLDYELNTVIYDEKLSQEMLTEFKDYIDKSIEITLDHYKNPPISQRTKELIGRLVVPIT